MYFTTPKNKMTKFQIGFNFSIDGVLTVFDTATPNETKKLPVTMLKCDSCGINCSIQWKTTPFCINPDCKLSCRVNCTPFPIEFIDYARQYLKDS